VLDPNHTHFILVDDGTQRQSLGFIGSGVVHLRAELEAHISRMKTIGGKGRLIVLLLS